MNTYKVVSPGDYIISLRSFQGGFERSDLEGIVSPAYTVFNFVSSEDQDGGYWSTYFKTYRFIESLKQIIFGIRDGKAISFGEFGSLLLNNPSLLEQQTIAKFFSILDNLIAAHERKCELLKKKKAYYLQQIFSQKLRFKGFTQPWQQRKLGEIAKHQYGGGTPKTSVPQNWNGRLPWIQSSDLSEESPLWVQAHKKITQTGLNSSAAQIVPAHSIAIVNRVGVGKVALLPFSYSSSQDFVNLADFSVDIEYAAYAVSAIMKQKAKQTQGTSIKGVPQSEILRSNIAIPQSSDEQKAIAALCKTVDILIAAETECESLLKKNKQFYLQKMFV
ncbi:restriction endonuclease subunit S [Bombiscardovia apis]|uniref:restriction endonuclease subunit S n=1 Tax=Bombiscardovia apis TaxID=2932182 RepID=UPI00295301EF|nr:restriction endonuclease subunit S [Bombiscardovia apis]